MARTALALQYPTSDGLNPTYSAANADGHSLVNDGRTVLIVKNASAGSINVTAQTPGTVDGLAVADKVVAVPAGGERHFKYDPRHYNRPAGGTDPDMVWIDFSAVASVTVAAIHS